MPVSYTHLDVYKRQPTNISTKSEPESEKNGTPASPATALARRVLPVPGGPTRSAPVSYTHLIEAESILFMSGERSVLSLNAIYEF